MHPCWHPDDDELLTDDDNQDDGDWTLASILRIARAPVSGADMEDPGSLRRDEPCGPEEDGEREGPGRRYGRGRGRHGTLSGRSGLM